MLNNNNIHFTLLTNENISEYINLLQNLSNTLSTSNQLNTKQFEELNKLYPFIQIWLIHDYITKRIIGCGTIIIEPKFIHNCGYVGHIEDVCISSEYQGKGYGQTIIQHLIDISKLYKCYKIILDCNKENIQFYKKCGFSENQTQMSIYLN